MSPPPSSEDDSDVPALVTEEDTDLEETEDECAANTTLTPEKRSYSASNDRPRRLNFSSSGSDDEAVRFTARRRVAQELLEGFPMLEHASAGDEDSGTMAVTGRSLSQSRRNVRRRQHRWDIRQGLKPKPASRGRPRKQAHANRKAERQSAMDQKRYEDRKKVVQTENLLKAGEFKAGLDSMLSLLVPSAPGEKTPKCAQQAFAPCTNTYPATTSLYRSVKVPWRFSGTWPLTTPNQ